MNTTGQIHFEKTIKGFAYNVIGVILPIILSSIPIFVLRKYSTFFSFLDDGQVLLIAAGLYTSSIYLFGENKTSIRNKGDKLLNFFAFWLLILSSAFYAIIYCLSLIDMRDFCIDRILIRIVSSVLFLISVISIYRSIYIDFLKIYPQIDVKEESKKEVDNIMKNL